MHCFVFLLGVTTLGNDIISGVVSGIVSGIVVGIVLWLWQRDNRRLTNSLEIRKMHNDILLSPTRVKSEHFEDSLLNLFDYIAISHKKGELDDEEYEDWRRTLKHYCMCKKVVDKANITPAQYSDALGKMREEIEKEKTSQCEIAKERGAQTSVE